MTRMAAHVPTCSTQQSHRPRSGCGPPFTVTEKRDGYEVRSYNESKWIGTTVLGTSWKAATDTAVGRLVNYISVNNPTCTAKRHVVTKIVPSQGPMCENTFQVLLLFPEMAPPTSDSDASLTVHATPPMTAFVAEYSGPDILSDDIVIDQADKLASALGRDGVTFCEEHYFTTTYIANPTFMEVWFTEK